MNNNGFYGYLLLNGFGNSVFTVTDGDGCLILRQPLTVKNGVIFGDFLYKLGVNYLYYHSLGVKILALVICGHIGFGCYLNALRGSGLYSKGLAYISSVAEALFGIVIGQFAKSLAVSAVYLENGLVVQCVVFFDTESLRSITDRR